MTNPFETKKKRENVRKTKNRIKSLQKEINKERKGWKSERKE